ncbi:hypothetical protein HPB48_003366 [Haemaphysalis longicornis]|uniref:Carboxylic ester hydrolase n=1 Tax=Haemaphysalis longicornis TaxID=44386 RepID=A0A9J6GB54_HAELO|nr:hypothetical protein HPB48_003366 [Haemaphysalis longicornis]
MAKGSAVRRSPLSCVLGGFVIAFVVAVIATILLTKAYEGVPVPRASKGAQAPCLIVGTTRGQVEGTLSRFTDKGNVYSTVAFYGIPFAKPPLGKLRFAPPTCAALWTGVFNASYKRPPCFQETKRLPKNVVIDASNTTEDCLHVNVWVPGSCVGEQRAQRRAIVFWLHGGSFSSGGNSYDIYDGRFIAAIGDVLVVVPNFRLSVFGYLNSGTGDVAGNMALHDQILALRWLHENAEQFGGDRERILLAGHSSGAITVSLLMTSPLVARHGSFRRAYLMSGTMSTPIDGNKGKRAEGYFAEIAANIGCQAKAVASQLECLRCLNASEIRKGAGSLGGSMMPSIEGPVFPGGLQALEEWFLPFRGRDAMISATQSEGMAFLQSLMPGVIEKREPITAEMLQRAFPSHFPGVDPSLVNFILAPIRQRYDLSDPENKGWVQFVGDMLFRCAGLAFGKELAGTGAKVYHQVFVPKPSFTVFAGDTATHGEDMVMLFGYPFQYPHFATDEERATSRRMITTMANFAKNGCRYERATLIFTAGALRSDILLKVLPASTDFLSLIDLTMKVH